MQALPYWRQILLPVLSPFPSVKIPPRYLTAWSSVMKSDELTKRHVPRHILSLGVFIFRGLCYAGFANRAYQRLKVPVAYIASPGRIAALRVFLTEQREVSLIDYAQHEYADLIEQLCLPRAGYNFSEFNRTFNPLHSSTISHELAGMPPFQALQVAMEYRRSPAGLSLHERWAEQLWDKGRSCAEGVRINQVVKDTIVFGDLIQIAHARDT